MIDKPGIYDGIPMDDYHGQLTEGPSISSSGLRAIETQSPAHYYAYSYLNPHKEERSTPAMDFGRCAHALMLGDDAFERAFVEPPFTDWATNQTVNGIEYKAQTPKAFKESGGGEPDMPEGVVYKPIWRAAREAEGKTVIMPHDMKTVHRMADALSRDQLVKAGVLDGAIEQTIVWRDKETGIWCKARPDVIPLDDWLADYKTIADISPHKRSQAIIDRGYYAQLAFIAEGLIAVGRPAPTNFVLVFQEKSPPYCVVAERVGWEMVKWGAQQNRRALRTFAKCLETGDWPGPFQPEADFLGPNWFHKRMDEEESGGLLPAPPAWINQVKKDEAA